MVSSIMVEGLVFWSLIMEVMILDMIFEVVSVCDIIVWLVIILVMIVVIIFIII